MKENPISEQEMGFENVEKPLAGFSDKLLQSAARTICSP